MSLSEKIAEMPGDLYEKMETAKDNLNIFKGINIEMREVDLTPNWMGRDEDFDDVYEAYKRFYTKANAKGTRGKDKAAREFLNEVSNYLDADEEDMDAGMGYGLFTVSQTDGKPSPMNEKYDKDELRRYLENKY